MPAASKPIDHRAVADYYERTWIDYRIIWLNRSNRALHLGYWDSHTRRHPDALANTNRVVAAKARLAPGQRVLDAGCGVGGTALWIAERHDVDVVGITITGDQATRAVRYAAERGLAGRIAFGLMDFCRTGLRDDSFDALYAIESVCHANDKADFLREAHRVLKPGGRLVLHDYFRTQRPHQPDDERLLTAWLDSWAVPDLDTLSEFAASAATAGFADVDARDITAAVRRSARRLYLSGVITYPVAIALHALRVRDAVQHANYLSTRHQYRALRRGLWRYGSVSARKPLAAPPPPAQQVHVASG